MSFWILVGSSGGLGWSAADWPQLPLFLFHFAKPTRWTWKLKLKLSVNSVDVCSAAFQIYLFELKKFLSWLTSILAAISDRSRGVVREVQSDHLLTCMSKAILHYQLALHNFYSGQTIRKILHVASILHLELTFLRKCRWIFFSIVFLGVLCSWQIPTEPFSCQFILHSRYRWQIFNFLIIILLHHIARER